ncbi:unnamed protein product [Rotaria magnacalcarata]
MDVEIKSGTNVIIYAYGLTDPIGDINYHQNRRGSRMTPLQSYANPPTENKFASLDYFEFRLNNYTVPSNDTTYHCKHKTLIDPNNVDLVHHLVLYECDPTVKFDDNNLPEGVCDDYYREFSHCLSNTATVWAIVEFPTEAGDPVGGDFGIKYYVIEMHYNNPN